MAGKKKRKKRIAELLGKLALDEGTQGKIRGAVLLALSDDATPHPTKALAREGYSISTGAGTAKLFEYAARELRLPSKIDREQRDYVFPQLIEVGLLDKATILTAKQRRKTDQVIHVGEHLVAKSANSSYVLTAESRALLEVPDREWPAARDEWLKGSQNRRQKRMQQRATAGLSGEIPETKHTALIRACVEALLKSTAADFELVFLDIGDGDRIDPKWRKRLDSLRLIPDLGSKWPDAILVKEDTRAVWFVDGVTSDGEIDESRATALREWAAERGFSTAGLTTAYETWKAAAGRQAKHKNLATGSSLWIAEDGGRIFAVDSLAESD